MADDVKKPDPKKPHPLERSIKKPHPLERTVVDTGAPRPETSPFPIAERRPAAPGAARLDATPFQKAEPQQKKPDLTSTALHTVDVESLPPEVSPFPVAAPREAAKGTPRLDALPFGGAKLPAPPKPAVGGTTLPILETVALEDEPPKRPPAPRFAPPFEAPTFSPQREPLGGPAFSLPREAGEGGAPLAAPPPPPAAPEARSLGEAFLHALARRAARARQ